MNENENGWGEADIPAGPETPALELEDMTEKRLTAQFSSLDKFAIKKLRRVLAKSSACTQEFEKAKRTVDKIQAKTKSRQERRTLAAEQTQLLSHSTDALNKEPCALCQHVFLKINLAMKVSYKSILDLQQSWQQRRDALERGAESDKPTALSPEPEFDPAASGDRILSRVQQAQLTLLLKPSSAAQKAKVAEAKRVALETQKKKNDVARAHELSRCDPLDFDPCRLNSDDDDDSDVEEVVEIDADGRPRIAKRRRQKTGRVPAQLGLVSKRLHYDQLRSRTLPSLNNKEWQVIG
ncbi:hypothetical protein PybrP1_012126 [[Pythium] brassicae (nom. inval.)]|nr:hypothetical protein PybrP1_012126 [[Pythium] brassicae (nom. inval.)]